MLIYWHDELDDVDRFISISRRLTTLRNGSMTTYQESINFSTRGRGSVEITSDISRVIESSGIRTGIALVFVQHTSCSVMITENADPSVRKDLEMLACRWAPDGDPDYRHDSEGKDDMAAHARSLVAGTSVTVPVSGGQLALGTWQGLYLWEHRAKPHRRSIVVTVIGD